ncbi:hypothetical protein EWM62_15640 [Mucilaginibacter terrigena]|uniref:Uncharacterized protein n=1 Tax=Mucilaginibacter terrigena TaxID=2492395 RepID=A0A4Q5LKE3_9SPHI|nr:hypothetical protein [Mucilaginibacter terrigena]RYU87924.1 hypothetical protein EWM62_15640 [Mucilaginibacter terrigena]
MTRVELKEKLIAKIGTTNDEELLNQISRLVNLELFADEIYKLNPEEFEAVKEGIAQIESGLFVSEAEANRTIDKCLGR